MHPHALATAVVLLHLLAPASLARPERPALVLDPIAKLAPGPGNEFSGIVRSRVDPTLFWTINDSGDEPRVYPIRADGTVATSVRSPETPGLLIAGAINSDWEDIAIDASGRHVIPDLGNNSNARRDLTIYLVEEPEATAERTTFTTRFLVRYPDQRAHPALRDDFNFDAEGVFTVADDIFILSKNRSDTFTKLYRVDDRDPSRVNTLTYLDRFDLQGQATGADASPDGLRLAVLTYSHVYFFERAYAAQPFFAGRVLRRAYTLRGTPAPSLSDSESIAFETDDTLLIADESRGELFRFHLQELDEVRPAPVIPADGANLSVMSYNLRFAGADTGVNAWEQRVAAIRETIRAAGPDILGVQECVSLQAEWLKELLPSHAFVGVGRRDGRDAGEFVPILFRTDRFTLLASGHFWLSETPDFPGSRSWDAAFERMATWVRLFDHATSSAILVVNTHLDHVGSEARANSLALLRHRIKSLADGAPVIVTGDFNTPADEPPMTSLASPGFLHDTFRSLYPTPDSDEATFCAWDARTTGKRIDWILASPRWHVIDSAIDRRMIGGRTGSDHYPVTATLRLPPAQLR